MLRNEEVFPFGCAMLINLTYVPMRCSQGSLGFLVKLFYELGEGGQRFSKDQELDRGPPGIAPHRSVAIALYLASIWFSPRNSLRT